MKNVVEVWTQRYGEGTDFSVAEKCLRNVLEGSPHDDGLMRVTSAENGKTYLVPMEHIILYGLKGSELPKFPLEKNARGKN